MGRRILLIRGHPDASRAHLCHALADAHADGAREAGHGVRVVDVAWLDVPVLRSAEGWELGSVPASLAEAQAAIERADHLVVLFPLRLGDMPARVVVTMRMPALVDRWVCRARSPKSLERNVLGRAGA